MSENKQKCSTLFYGHNRGQNVWSNVLLLFNFIQHKQHFSTHKAEDEKHWWPENIGTKEIEFGLKTGSTFHLFASVSCIALSN